MTLIGYAGERRRMWVAAGVCLLSFAVFWWAQRAAHVSLIDLRVYRAEGATVLSGGDLYALRATAARLPTTYPPFAALLFTALTVPGPALLGVLATAVNLALLVVFVRLSLRLAGCPHAGAGGWWVAAGAVWCEPVWTTLRYGQVNLALAVLVLADPALRPAGPGRHGRWAGVGIGLAAAVKLTPALFVAFLLATGLAARLSGRDGGPWLRATRTATAVFAGAGLLGAVVLPHDSWRFWTAAVFRASRVGHAEDTANQALRGVLARLLHTGDPGALWVLAAVPVAALGLGVAVTAELRGRRAWAVCGCAVTSLLVSPVSWTHHWVWCVPVAVLLWSRGRRAVAAGLAVAFCAYVPWWVPHGSTRPELRLGGGQLVLSAVYAGAAGVFLALAWQADRVSAARTGTARARAAWAEAAQAVTKE
uniref:glycosyltransferase 87 family protein n=1 Tax=Streptomyces corallincola TaxID=2851888 RepID=UPI0027E264FD|nr:glycosyltransferase 87 family protein [Streptomyces corallincola]